MYVDLAAERKSLTMHRIIVDRFRTFFQFLHSTLLQLFSSSCRGGCARQRTLPSSMLCRGNCDENELDEDSVNPEGMLAEPFLDFNRPVIPVDDEPEPNIVSSDEMKLPSTSLCRYNCDDENGSPALTDAVRLSAESTSDNDRPKHPVADQPKPNTIPDMVDETPTDMDPMTGAGQYPERTEFVVHVEQEESPADNPPPSPPAQAHHHHHHRPQSVPPSSGDGGSRRRHHRLPCWDYEKRERQCLNGGQCFAIQFHNGIRRSGCSCTSSWTGERCEMRYIEPNVWDELEAEENFRTAEIGSATCFIMLAGFVLLSAIYACRFKRRTRSALGEKPDGTGDQLVVLRSNNYPFCSSSLLHTMDHAFQANPPTYESIFGYNPECDSPFCPDPKRSTFDRPLSKQSNNVSVAPPSECDEDNCAKGRPFAAPYDTRRYGTCSYVA